MRLFNFFNRGNASGTEDIKPTEEGIAEDAKIVDRNLFIKNNDRESEAINGRSETAWKRIFDRIRKDYESDGYNDALNTADNKYREDNIQIIKLDLLADIEEAEIEIKEYIREVDFHITSRREAELLDLVNELVAKKEICIERLTKMNEIKTDVENNTGTSARIILAYKRGFNKGLAALSMANIINRNV